MDSPKTPVIISQDDYKMLKQYAEQFPTQHNEMTLSYELNRAIVVKNDELPDGCVRLNSKVKVFYCHANAGRYQPEENIYSHAHGRCTDRPLQR
jgi:hypothetical protein